MSRVNVLGTRGVFDASTHATSLEPAAATQHSFRAAIMLAGLATSQGRPMSRRGQASSDKACGREEKILAHGANRAWPPARGSPCLGKGRPAAVEHGEKKMKMGTTGSLTGVGR
eukprot:1150935-Pelagomonas_calceolata.AAC.3